MRVTGLRPMANIPQTCVDCDCDIEGDAKACPKCGSPLCGECFAVAPICIACEEKEYADDDDDFEDDDDDDDDDEDDDDAS